MKTINSKYNEIEIEINGSVIKLTFIEDETDVKEELCNILTNSHNERNLK